MLPALKGRKDRAVKLALEGHVTHKAELRPLGGSFCTSSDSLNGYICKHRLAAYLVGQAMWARLQALQESLSRLPRSPEQPAQLPDPLTYDENAVAQACIVLEASSQFLQ
ncbi:MAG: hypothetical protein MUC85_02395 [Anaerolineales bacterium]|jgi:hypothetical protein|nr:hypothetical protein [Anaerolineales bacterium]